MNNETEKVKGSPKKGINNKDLKKLNNNKIN